MMVIIWMIFIWFLAIPIKQSMHIFQQNHYQLDRYKTWILQQSKQCKKEFIRKGVYFLPCYLLFLTANKTKIYILYILLLFVYGFLMFQKERQVEYVKPIQYTTRMKRLMVVQLFYHSLMFLCFFVYVPIQITIILTPILYIIPWLMLLISAMTMQPIENYIQLFYVKDAKSKLNAYTHLKRIGITGSYGKTSTKHILYAMLEEEYYTCMSPHSFNNKMGLTITIRTLLQPLHEVLIAEMGADHVGEIKELAQFIAPFIGVVTAIGTQHMETFQSQEAIINEKMQLIEQLPSYGIAILNYDNPWIRNYKIQNTCKVITYGILNEEVDVRAVDIEYHTKGTTFTIRDQEHAYTITTKLLGEHNVQNILAAVCVAKVLHVKEDLIQNAIRRIPYVEHRLQLKKMADYTILDDAYNSNPQGAYYALQVLNQMPNQHWIITPGFLDLGEESKYAHQMYAKQMMKVCHYIVLVGKKQTQTIYETLLQENYPSHQIYVVNTSKEALQLVMLQCHNQEVILIENDLPDAFNH